MTIPTNAGVEVNSLPAPVEADSLPVTDFERGIKYGEMAATVQSLCSRVDRLERRIEDAESIANTATDIAVTAHSTAQEASEDVEEIQTEQAVESIAEDSALADVAEAALEVAAEAVSDEHDDAEHVEDEVTVIGEHEEPSNKSESTESEHESTGSHAPTRSRKRRAFGGRR